MDDSGFEAMMEAAGFGRQRADDGLTVRFFIQPMRDEKRSAEEGRHVYSDVEMIEIRVPGEADIQRHPVTDQDRRRFQQRYERWLQTKDDTSCEGMPLSEWTQITASMREELALFGIRSVEQLANVPDSAMSRIGPYMAVRQKARDWLANAKSDAVLVKLRTENENLAVRVATLEKMLQTATNEIKAARGEVPATAIAPAPAVNMQEIVASVMAAIEAAKPPRKKPGPKPKNGNGAVQQ